MRCYAIASIIILLVDVRLHVLESGNVDESILEGNSMIVIIAEQLHNLSLPATLEGRGVGELETEVTLVVLGTPQVLLLGD